MTDEMLYYMWLTIGFSPCNPRKWDTLKYYDSVTSLYNNMKSAFPYLSAYEQSCLTNAKLSQAENMIDYCDKNNINIYYYNGKNYPKKLVDINNPPAIIFSLGKLDNINLDKSVAIVGSRNSDEYSEKITTQISAELALQNVSIISGFARGIDSCAHKGALNVNGHTIAILGCGVEHDYPKNTSDFKLRIAKNGAVISEFFPSTSPCPANFKIRNRITSGLSDAVLCTQASKISGALNTVCHGLEQGKDILVTPPHDINSKNYQGIISLLKDGAYQIYCASDIVKIINK